MTASDQAAAAIAAPIRAALPARRGGESFEVEFPAGSRLRHRLQVNRFGADAGDVADQLAEVFVNSSKPNSPIDAVGGDFAILISLLLQHRVPLARIGHALRREADNSRASIAGVIVDALAAIERGEQPDMIRAPGRRRRRRKAAGQ